MITIFILILLFSFSGKQKQARAFLEKVKGVDWQSYIEDAKNRISLYARKAGRAATRPLLQWWFVMVDENTTTWEKACIYGAIVYIAIPNDLIPRKIFKIFGILDDIAVGKWLYDKINSKITPDMRNAVEDILDEWFGSVDIIAIK